MKTSILLLGLIVAIVLFSGCTQQQSQPATFKTYTCSEISGHACKSNEQCPGTERSVSDVTTCCSVVCTQKQPSEPIAKTCSEQNGFICNIEEKCEGTIIKATDSTSCCSVKCTQINTAPTNNNPTSSCPINLENLNYKLYRVHTDIYSLDDFHVAFDFSKPLENDYTVDKPYLAPLYCRKGANKGENINYFYCQEFEISKTPISESGEIQDSTTYVITPIFDVKESSETDVGTNYPYFGLTYADQKVYQITGSKQKLECTLKT